MIEYAPIVEIRYVKVVNAGWSWVFRYLLSVIGKPIQSATLQALSNSYPQIILHQIYKTIILGI